MATPLTIDALPSVSISAGSIIAVVTGGLAKRSTVEAIGQNLTTVVATTSVVTPTIDSGTTGSLSLKTNNGTTQVTIANSGIVSFTGNQVSGSSTANFVLGTNAGQGQLTLIHNAGANTVTITSGTNPTISTTAGSLNLAPALQFSTLGAFAASDKYLIVDSSGNVHKSALGPAS